MSKTLFRFQAAYTPDRLTDEEKAKVGVPAYPKDVSDLIRELRARCREGNRDEYVEAIKSFVEGDRFVSAAEDGDPLSAEMTELVLRHGPAVPESSLLGFHREHLEDLPRWHENVLPDRRARMADSLVATYVLGLTGHPNAVDYQLHLRVLHVLELMAEAEEPGSVTTGEVEEVLTSPVVLPQGIVGFRCCDHLDVPTEARSRAAEARRPDPGTGADEAAKREADCQDCGCDEECVEPSGSCPCLRPYISDLFVVEERLHCYEAAEVAYIENVARGEERIRQHRRMSRTESFDEQETTTTEFEERDHSVADRFSLEKEVDKTLETDMAFEAGLTVNAKYGPDVSLTTQARASFRRSKSTAHRVAESYSRDVVDRSVTRLEKEVRKLTSTRRIREVVEKNKHRFSNIDGEDAMASIYFFVNKLSKAQLLNYGKRMIFDITVKDPSALWKHLMEKELDADDVPLGVPNPGAPPDLTPEDVSADPDAAGYWADLVKEWGVKGVTPPPEKTRYGSVLIERHHTDKGLHVYDGLMFAVPAGYQAVRYQPDGLVEWDGDGVSVGITIGPRHSVKKPTGTQQDKTFQARKIDNLEGNIPIGAYSWDATLVQVVIRIKMEPTPTTWRSWQIEVYDAVMTAYKEQKSAYERALQEHRDRERRLADSQKQRLLGDASSPFRNREIERTELKRAVISMLTCSHFEDLDAMKRRVAPCGFPQMDLEEAQKEGLFIQFIQQAFEWNLMTYVLDEYMFEDRCTWAEKIQEDDADALFQRFKAAGAARVQISVREGFEPLVTHFLMTGEIWGGTGLPPVPGDPHYVSMAHELKLQAGAVQEDRQGTLAAQKGEIVLDGKTDDLTLNDIDRKIVIEGTGYRIVDLAINSSDDVRITLDRPYEGAGGDDLKFAIGPLVVGAPWNVRTPTDLIYLQNEDTCLPCYPLPECEA